MNPTTSPIKKTLHIEDKKYCTALESTISVPIVDPSKHSTFLLQKQLHDEIKPAFEDNIDISDDETVITKKISTKMNSVQMTMMFKSPGEKKGIDNDDAFIKAIKK